MLLKSFMYTVYHTFNEECLKKKHFQHNLHFLCYIINDFKMFQSNLSFYKRFVNVLSKNICIENLYQTFFKQYNANVYLDMFRHPKVSV